LSRPFSLLRSERLASDAEKIEPSSPSKLRRAGADFLIVNLWGVGYRFWDQVDPSTS
jgi:hypothetical protein